MDEVFIIAEAGVNHNGSVELAKQLIDAAADAGANAVKFQTFKAERLVTKTAQKADYQTQSTTSAESQFAMLARLELDESAHREIIQHCHVRQIQFLSTPFDCDSIDLLAQLGMTTFKIPSGEITNLPYLRKVASVADDVILSTGMADLIEVETALHHLVQNGMSKQRITVLHATTEYPCPYNEVNLRAMQTMREAFGVKVGYSDHTLGIDISVAAVALGACLIEKHFTLDCRMPGPDHQASLEPDELNALVKAIRHVSSALGDGTKQASPSELKNKCVARKSIVAAREIKVGEKLTPENLTVKRPGTGISPMQWDDIIGKIAVKNFAPDDLIDL